MSQDGATYASAGVDIAAGDAAVERLRAMVPGIGGFAGQFPFDPGRYRQPVLVASTDGVGTKMVVARATGRYDTVGIDLVAMCVDDLVCVGAEPLFLLDYVATGKVDPDRVATLVAGVHEGCRRAGCTLLGGETAEHAGVMAPDEVDLAGFAVGAAERGTLLPRPDIAVGDAVIGLGSSGLHSNGFSLVRKIVAQCGLPFDAPAPFSPVMTLGGALLTPTRLYVRSCLRAIRELSLIHI